jgi:alpha-tubulin suppressor-like RCC1 family protein
VRTTRIASSILLVASLAACHDLFGGGGDKPKPAQIAAASTPPASATVGSQVPLSVKVTDASGQAVKGTTVQWAVTGGGGSITPASSTTDATGVATATWTLGNTAGVQTATASFDATHSVTFTVTATAGAASGVTVTPDSVNLSSLGDTVRLHATAVDAGNNPAPVAWQSLDPGIATVSSTGLVTSLANGRARIVASSGAKADTAIVKVQQVIASVVANPGAVTVAAGNSQPVTATASDARGQTVAGATFSWLSLNPAIATVSGTGVITGVSTGGTQVIVSSGGKADTVAVTVTGAVLLRRPSVGRLGSCAVSTSNVVYCWGTPQQDPAVSVTRPAPVSASVPFDTVAVGEDHRCALTPAGAAWCWGNGLVGQLGNGTTSGGFNPNPVPVSGGLTFTQIAAGYRHTCGLTAAGAAYCWGYNNNGQLGTGSAVTCGFQNLPCAAIPVAVTGGHTFTQIDANADRTCAVATTGDVYCWGQFFGTSPTVAFTGRTYTQVAVGGLHACALSGGAAYCFGDNRYGQLGTGNGFNQLSPTPVAGGLVFTQIDAGTWFTCGITPGGAAWCWGRNGDSELGNAAAGVQSSVPVPVSGSHAFSRLSSGEAHTCAQAADGVYCWGGNVAGELVDGTTTNRAVPVKVLGQP